tara:strand:- start:355 stop:624 length:270 start_codon:yes stop_codon:yes gene_type:complete
MLGRRTTSCYRQKNKQEASMNWLIIIGTIITTVGIAGLGYCIKTAMVLRSKDMENGEVTVQLQRLVPINLASVCISTIGLMVIITSILI